MRNDPRVRVLSGLAHLGFDEDAGFVYLRLLSGRKNLHELATSPLDDSRTRRAVRLLLEKGLIGKGKGASNYYAIDPEIAWQSTIADLVWAHNVSLGPVWHLPETGSAAVEGAREVLTSIRDGAREIYVYQSDLPTAGAEFKTRHPKKIEQSIVDAIESAGSEIRAASRTPRWPNVAPIWTAITERMGNGVPYHRIADIPEVVDHGLSVIRRDVFSTGVDLRLIEYSRLDSSFYLVDDVLLVVRPAGSDETTVSHRPATVRPFLRRHRDWHDAAIPARYVLPLFRRAGAALLQQAVAALGQDAGDLLKLYIKYGRFALPEETLSWSPARTSHVTAALIRAGLVEESLIGAPVPRYGLSDVILSELRANLAHAECEQVPCQSCWEPREFCECS